MQAVAHLMSQSVEADIVQGLAAEVSIEPVSKDALVRAAKLPRTGKHTTTVYPDREAESRTVFQSQRFTGNLARPV